MDAYKPTGHDQKEFLMFLNLMKDPIAVVTMILCLLAPQIVSADVIRAEFANNQDAENFVQSAQNGGHGQGAVTVHNADGSISVTLPEVAVDSMSDTAMEAISSHTTSIDIEPAIPTDVMTISGVTMSLDGTWVSPCDHSSGVDGDTRITETFSGSSWIHIDYIYTSIDGSCSGTETIDGEFDITFETGDVVAITGWLDHCCPVTPPLAQDGSGPLSNNESVTSATLTIHSVTPPNPEFPPGLEMPYFWVVDDTVAGAPVYYSTSDNDSQKASSKPYIRQ